MRLTLSITPVLLILAACGTPDTMPTSSTISLEKAIPPAAITGTRGVAVDPQNGDLIVINENVGIVEIDHQGEVIRTLKNNENGLVTGAMTDVAKLPDGKYVIASNGDTFLYDPITKTQTSFFCLVPAISPTWLENGAVAYDAENEMIIAAPAYFSEGGQGPDNSFHASYSAIDAELIGQVDVRASGFVAKGLAIDAAKDRVLAVEQNKLGVFTRQGQLIRIHELDIEDASGLAIDAAGEKMFITSQSKREILVVDLAQIL
jgi:DNA-binding beta-propeller fold protein YncE